MPRPILASALAADSGGQGARDRKDNRKDKRALILDAAIKVFAEKGYHGSRVADIAREADIAYGLVYHYFKNKEEILRSVVDERWGGFLEVMEEIAQRDTSTQDKLVSVAALILNGYRVAPNWVKVLVLALQRSSRFAEPGQVRAVGRMFQILARMLRAGQESGELRPELDPDVACYVFGGALEIVVTSLVLGLIQVDGRAPTDSDYYLKVARTVVEIFLNGLARREEPHS
jgi:TetR/AcrR family fatty acid metabolism transcriptional regulator